MAKDGTYEYYQSIQSRPVFKPGDIVASFAVNPQKETVFVGLFDVESSREVLDAICPIRGKRGVVNEYQMPRKQELSEYEGRVVIDWGPGLRSWVQKADTQNKKILEIRREFKEPDFPGFRKLCVDINNLDTIPEQWKSVLASVNGIYLLTCNRTGKQYVGSAYGDRGIWGRWLEYHLTGNGGNVELCQMKELDFRATVLEVINPSARPEDVVSLENDWKEKLMIRTFGLNRN